MLRVRESGTDYHSAYLFYRYSETPLRWRYLPNRINHLNKLNGECRAGTHSRYTSSRHTFNILVWYDGNHKVEPHYSEGQFITYIRNLRREQFILILRRKARRSLCPSDGWLHRVCGFAAWTKRLSNTFQRFWLILLLKVLACFGQGGERVPSEMVGPGEMVVPSQAVVPSQMVAPNRQDIDGKGVEAY